MNKSWLARQPNILIINCDDLGYGDVGCYGCTVNDTPVLDRLAGDGLRFTDFYMASPVCSPSRAALLTGCYPPRIGFGEFDGFPVLFPGHRYGLHPDEVTIARVLAEVGYATKAVGKWHCCDQAPFLPTRHGFESWFGIPYSNDMGRQAHAEGAVPIRELLAQFGLQLPVDEFPPLPRLVSSPTKVECCSWNQRITSSTPGWDAPCRAGRAGMKVAPGTNRGRPGGPSPRGLGG